MFVLKCISVISNNANKHEQLEACLIVPCIRIILWNDLLRNWCGDNLRTYRTFKYDFIEECYLSMNITLSQRRVLASLRCGVAPFHIETGRYVQLSVDERICFTCVLGSK